MKSVPNADRLRKRKRRNRLDADPNEPILAVGYARISDPDKAEEGPSIPGQFDDIDGYISRRIKDGWIYGEKFSDGMSGRRDDRDDYQRMKATIRTLTAQGRRVVVVIQRLDRLGRHVRERADIWEELDELGVELHSHAEGLVSEVLYNLLASIAQEEARLASERISNRWKSFERAGWHRPNREPWGYTHRPATEDERARMSPKVVLVPHDDEAVYVRELWQRAADGEGVQKLSQWAATLPSDARGGRTMSYCTVRYLLRTPLYIGRFGEVHDLAACVDETPPGEPCPVLAQPLGNWTPLVSDDVWQRYHEQYRRDTTLSRAGRPDATGTRGGFLLTGFLRCERCGSGMVGNTSPAGLQLYRGKLREMPERRRYHCKARRLGVNGPERPCNAMISADAVETPLLDALDKMFSVLSNARLQRMISAEYQQQRQRSNAPDDTSKRRAKVEATLKAARASRGNLARLYGDGKIDRDAYEDGIADVQSEIERATATLAELSGRQHPPKLPELAVVLASVGGYVAALDSDDNDAKRGVLAELIEWISPRRVAHGQYEVSIGFRPIGEVLRDAAAAGRSTPMLVVIGERASTCYHNTTFSADTVAS